MKFKVILFLVIATVLLSFTAVKKTNESQVKGTVTSNQEPRGGFAITDPL